MDSRKPTVAGCCVLIVLCCLVWCAPAAAETARRSSWGGEGPLVFGYSPQVFYNVDPRDVTGLLEVWARALERKMNSGAKSSIVAYKNTGDMGKALSKKEVDVLVMIPEEFIRLRENFRLVPILSADSGNHFYNEMLLLVRKGSGITGVGQLRGKSLRVNVSQMGTVPMNWLDSLLATRGLSNAQGLFGAISEYSTSTQAVMPVFFGKADACLVNLSQYETMVELNPQLGSQLRILERSPGFATGILAVRKDIQKTQRDAIVKILQEMHNEPKGKQLMTIFRINRMVPFLPEHLTAVEKVIKDHRSNLDSVARRQK